MLLALSFVAALIWVAGFLVVFNVMAADHMPPATTIAVSATWPIVLPVLAVATGLILAIGQAAVVVAALWLKR